MASLAATPQAGAFMSKMVESAKASLSQRRPWMEMADRSAFARPESMGEATSRIRKNWTYFRVNYLVVISLTLALSLLTHPVSLFMLALLLGGWVFLYVLRTDPLVLFGRTYSDREVLGILSVLTVVVIFLTTVGSLLISALMVGVGLVCLHAAFRVPEDLFLDETESAGPGGLLSFLGGTPHNAVASHV